MNAHPMRALTHTAVPLRREVRVPWEIEKAAHMSRQQVTQCYLLDALRCATIAPTAQIER